MQLPGRDFEEASGRLLVWDSLAESCCPGQEGGHSLIDLESQVAAFQLQAGLTKEQKSAGGTVEDATEAILLPGSQFFLMKQEELNTTGPSTLFTSGMACGWIKRNGMRVCVTLAVRSAGLADRLD